MLMNECPAGKKVYQKIIDIVQKCKVNNKDVTCDKQTGGTAKLKSNQSVYKTLKIKYLKLKKYLLS